MSKNIDNKGGSGSRFCEVCCHNRPVGNCITGKSKFIPKSSFQNANICLSCARKIRELINKIDKKEADEK